MAQAKPGLEKIPASAALLDALIEAGFLPARAGAVGRAWLISQNPRAWRQWVFLLTRGFGLALLLGGIAVFFISNWGELSLVVQFAILFALLLACLTGGWLYGPHAQGGQLSLLAASILTGIGLSIIGLQEEGFDFHHQMSLWAVLVAGWTFTSRFAPQWLFFLLLLNAVMLSWHVSVGGVFEFSLPLAHSLLNGAVFLAHARWGSELPSPARWIEPVLGALCLLVMLGGFHQWLWGGWTAIGFQTRLGALGAMLGMGGLLMYSHLNRQNKFLLLTMSVITLCLTASSSATQLIHDVLPGGVAPEKMLLYALANIAVFASGFLYLRNYWQAQP